MRVIRQLAGPVFVFAGAMHFAIPRAYHRIMPPYIPAPKAMVYVQLRRHRTRPTKPWLIVGREHHTVELDAEVEFFTWAHQRWPTERYTVTLDPGQLSPEP
ncbi:MAG TPA: hypothetical protein VGL51_06635 [Solirubrobacteraceae bacterium]|jgi:hypothetical protein